LVHHLRRVESLYADLFEDAPSLSIEGEVAGNLIFTGAEDDPDTLKTIAGLGFSHPASVSATIRNWHRGHRRATQTLRARQLLTELIPVILSAFGRTLDPGAAFAKFDDFLAGLPAGVQLFSMFRARPELLELLADVLGSAPRLAEHLARNPSALEGLLDVSIAAPLPPVAELKADVAHTLGHADGIQDVLDLARRWANDYKLRTGVQVLRNIVDCDQAAFDLSDIAEAALDGLIPHITNEFARVHGRIPGSEMAVVALGKLGSREMTPTSDLDLIFVYDHKGADGSDGEKPLAPTRYFARLSKRIINAVSAPTAEGKLYDIDMRLRPSGNAGPIASSFEAFAKYHEEKAWTWEHMALSRARVIAGDGALGAKISDVITKTLTAPRDAGQLRDDVIDMRTRLEREFHTESPWDTKYVRGGLVDIEFIVQYLQLKHAAARPDILSTNNHDTLKRLEAAEILAPHVAAELGDALFTWHAVQMVLRLTVDSAYRNLDAAALPESLKAVLARAARCDDFTALTSHLAGISENVLGHFNRIFELPDDGRNAAARPT
jgi:glutamate-ammonia-ligase adenylyltransferase